ncbi:hypothetical protein JCM5296_006121 [Sporobolomyces johnsonii]
MNFSSFAANLLSSHAPSEQPLFYSTREDHFVVPHEDDILGASYDSHSDGGSGSRKRGGRTWSFGDEGDERPSSDEDDEAESARSRVTRGAGGAASQLAAAVVPAFVSRLGGAGPGGGGRAAGGGGRGWKAYESVAAAHHPSRLGTLSDASESSSEPDDDGPLPGAFVSRPAPDADEPMDEPLLGRRTLFVYPVPGSQFQGAGANAHETYRDAGWIAAYGAALAGVLLLAISAWWRGGVPPPVSPPSPPSPSAPSPSPSLSLLSTLPTLSLLAVISLGSGAASLAYVLTMRHALAPLLTLSVLAGPALFATTGIVAFAGSFAMDGVKADPGWKTGVRSLAAACLVGAVVVGRASLQRRKGLQRAISVGELACQTIVAHPPLILLALALSLLSALVSVPFLALLASLLARAPSAPHLASYGSAFVLLVYVWTLSCLRGVCHAVVGGVVGSWYFEREGEEHPGVLEVTRASVARATGPSLGTVVVSSLVLSFFSSLSVALSSLARTLRSSSLPALLSPLSYLAPLFGALAGYAAFFNSYSLSYAGMTGEPWLVSARETAALLRANRARNIRDTALLRLTLFVSSTAWGLLAGLIAFFLASSRLAPASGGYAPVVAVVAYVVPMWTVKLCVGLLGDAVDALFICAHLDAENQLSHCPKAVEAFGQPEVESLNSSSLV